MMQLLRKVLRLSLLGGIAYGAWKALRARRGAESWDADSWVSTGAPGATTPSASPGAAGTAVAPAPAPSTVASAPVHPSPAETAPAGNGEAVPLPTMADEPVDGRSADAAGGGGPGPSRPATARPARARTGPARKAPTGKAEEPPGERLWVAANDGVCPPSHPVKAKLSSKIFHTPGARNYGRTHADRCYPDEQSAAADGLRPALR
jgi:hypothetical protein